MIARLIAGITAEAVDLASCLLKLDESGYLDFAAALAFGKHAENCFGALVALLIELVIKAGLNILFVFFIPSIKSKYLIIKGTFLGLINWFIIYAIFSIPKIKEFPHLSLSIGMDFNLVEQ